jgi:hypothetical protein
MRVRAGFIGRRVVHIADIADSVIELLLKRHNAILDPHNPPTLNLYTNDSNLLYLPVVYVDGAEPGLIQCKVDNEWIVLDPIAPPTTIQ